MESRFASAHCGIRHWRRFGFESRRPSPSTNTKSTPARRARSRRPTVEVYSAILGRTHSRTRTQEKEPSQSQAKLRRKPRWIAALCRQFPPSCQSLQRDTNETTPADAQDQAVFDSDVGVRLVDTVAVHADPALRDQAFRLTIRLCQSCEHEQLDQSDAALLEFVAADDGLRNFCWHVLFYKYALERALCRRRLGLSMPHRDDLSRQPSLGLPGMDAALLQPNGDGSDLVHGHIGAKLEVVRDKRVRQRHHFTIHLVGRFGNADRIAQRLAHLLHAVESHQQRGQQHDLRLLAELPLQIPAHQVVELLIGASQFNIGLQVDGIHGLTERVEQFVHKDGHAAAQAVGEVVAFEHAGDRGLGPEPDDFLKGHAAQPLAVEHDLRLLRLENFAVLISGGSYVALDFFPRQHRPGLLLLGRITNHAGEIADAPDGVLAEVLQLAPFAQHAGNAEVDIRRAGIDDELHPQWPALAQFGQEILFGDDLYRAAAEQIQLFFGRDIPHDRKDYSSAGSE